MRRQQSSDCSRFLGPQILGLETFTTVIFSQVFLLGLMDNCEDFSNRLSYNTAEKKTGQLLVTEATYFKPNLP